MSSLPKKKHHHSKHRGGATTSTSTSTTSTSTSSSSRRRNVNASKTPQPPPRASSSSSSSSRTTPPVKRWEKSSVPPKKSTPPLATAPKAGSRTTRMKRSTSQEFGSALPKRSAPRIDIDPESRLPCISLEAHEKEMYLVLFEQADLDGDGLVSDVEAVTFFKKSGLPTEKLAQIWSLVHINHSKSLNRNAFATAIRLISLAQDNKPMTLEQISRTAVFRIPQLIGVSLTKFSAPPPKAMSSSGGGSSSGAGSGSEWIISQDYAENVVRPAFAAIPKSRPHLLSGDEARMWLSQSRLPVSDLAVIWEHADVDKDGSLTEAEFRIALLLVHGRQAGKALPRAVPSTLLNSYQNPVSTGSGSGQKEVDIGAEQAKSLGDELYSKGDYGASDKYYTHAIKKQLYDLASTFRRRAAARFANGDTSGAFEDCTTALFHYPKYAMAHVTRGLCHLQLGNLAQAEVSLRLATSIDPTNPHVSAVASQVVASQQAERDGKKAERDGDIEAALGHYKILYENCPKTEAYLSTYLDLCMQCKKFDEAQGLVIAAQKISPNSPSLQWMQVQLSYEQTTDLSIMLSRIQEVLRLDPGHDEAQALAKNVRQLMDLKAKGNAHFKEKAFQAATDVYSDALNLEPPSSLSSILYANRGAAFKGMEKFDEAIADLTEAIKRDENYAKAYLRRGMCYMELEIYKDAVTDFSSAHTRDPFSQEIASMLAEAQALEAKNKYRDYYEILQISHDATQAEIKKAYRIMALKYHPDKTKSQGTSALKADKVFKDISTSYSVLSDEEQKARYDTEYAAWIKTLNVQK